MLFQQRHRKGENRKNVKNTLWRTYKNSDFYYLNGHILKAPISTCNGYFFDQN